MFGFGKQREKNSTQIFDAVMIELAPFEAEERAAGSQINLRKQVAPEYVQHLYKLCGDIRTTALLIWIMHQRNCAVGFLENMDPKVFVDEVREAGQDPNGEADEQYEVAKAFCNQIVEGMEHGQIVTTPAVKDLVSEMLASILSSWAMWRIRVQTASRG